MEDNDFKGRIDKVFGALIQLSSEKGKSWTLSDGEVQKRQWKRDESPLSREDTPCGSSFSGFMGGEDSNRYPGRISSSFSRDGDEDADSDDDVRPTERQRKGDAEEIEDEGQQMRMMVGMDSTLDHEDEEDEFDRVAVGREGVGERIYMRDIMAPGTRINFHNALPSSLKSAGRDSRANHYAAIARLKEDDDELGHANGGSERENGSFCTQDIKPSTELKSIMKRRRKQTEGKQNMEVDLPPVEDAAGGPGTCGTDSSITKPKKRVRFDLGVKEDPSGQMEEKHDMINVANSRSGSIVRGVSPADSIGHEHSCVPDYIQNPSKYIHYKLDWSNEDNDMINMQAFREFSRLVKPSASEQPLDLGSSPKSITFIPRKKAASSNKTREDSNHTINSLSAEEGCSEISNHSGALPVSIAAGEAVETESLTLGNDMGDSEKFDTIDRKVNIQRGTRKYRSKANEDEDTHA